MPCYRLVLEWDGRPFVGWQYQHNGVSVQQVLQQAFERFCGEVVTAHAAGRTDAGVHALGMVVSLQTEQSRDPDTIRSALNALMRPHPVVVLSAERAADDFHARFSCLGRAYLYRILARRPPPALDAGRVWWVPALLEIAPMQEAAALLVGRHDFSAFRSAHCQAASALKTLSQLTVSRVGDEIHLGVAARSFLHNQVRILAGTLRDVGVGRMTLADVSAALETGDRSRAGPTAPPDGLYFQRAFYADDAGAVSADTGDAQTELQDGE
jgi:tRNA pseudouridine38-40 synthase